MGNRLLKESICVSEQIDRLGWFEEVFFYRLLVNCDDYGVMDARPKILKAKLFPLKEVTPDDMTGALGVLVDVGLIRLYEIDGMPFLKVIKWSDHQRVRESKHKYPVEADCGNPRQVAASCGELRLVAEKGGSRAQPRAGAESESESESESNTNQNPTRARAEDADDDLLKISEDQNRVLNAAEDAGFTKSNTVRAKLIDLYAVYGMEKVLAGIESCARHGAVNLAYLEACMKDKPRGKPVSIVQGGEKKNGMGFRERDNSGAAEEAMERMRQMIREAEASGQM